MANKTAEERAKAGPRLPGWTAIRGKYKEISGYKPDITGNIKTYDADVAKAVELADKQKQVAPDTIDAWSKNNASMKKQVDDHLSEAEKLHDKLNDDYQKMSNDVKSKPDRTVDFLDDFDNRAESFIKARKALWDAVIKLDEAHLVSQRKTLKTVRDSLSKSDKEQKAALAECEKLEATIRKAISEYQKKAASAGNDDLVNALNGWMADF